VHNLRPGASAKIGQGRFFAAWRDFLAKTCRGNRGHKQGFGKSLTSEFEFGFCADGREKDQLSEIGAIVENTP